MPRDRHRKGARLEKLKDLIKGPDLIVAPVALNPIMAQMAALAGFKAAYLSGGSLGWYKGVTEAGLSLTEMIQVVVDIRTVSQDPGGARRRRRLGRSGPHPPHRRHVRGGGRRVHRDRGPASAAPGRAPHRHRQSGADRARRRPDQGGGRRPHQSGPGDRRAHQRAAGRGHGRRAAAGRGHEEGRRRHAVPVGQEARGDALHRRAAARSADDLRAAGRLLDLPDLQGRDGQDGLSPRRLVGHRLRRDGEGGAAVLRVPGIRTRWTRSSARAAPRRR